MAFWIEARSRFKASCVTSATVPSCSHSLGDQMRSLCPFSGDPWKKCTHNCCDGTERAHVEVKDFARNGRLPIWVTCWYNCDLLMVRR